MPFASRIPPLPLGEVSAGRRGLITIPYFASLVPLTSGDNINTNSSNHIPPLPLGEVSAGRRGLINVTHFASLVPLTPGDNINAFCFPYSSPVLGEVVVDRRG